MGNSRMNNKRIIIFFISLIIISSILTQSHIKKQEPTSDKVINEICKNLTSEELHSVSILMGKTANGEALTTEELSKYSPNELEAFIKILDYTLNKKR